MLFMVQSKFLYTISLMVELWYSSILFKDVHNQLLRGISGWKFRGIIGNKILGKI